MPGDVLHSEATVLNKVDLRLKGAYTRKELTDTYKESQ